ncbi:hypothetical protein K7X08_028659 [Anisodus acutangulus]|uniref:Uncharacterized protein n=1 Tax=Anisodus acutangulus TaxID=402998 RepID=A0A9Q1LWV5_9SOLA|nr:hypothetical protein K7X08_028659 [Anisodus acutangulus]
MASIWLALALVALVTYLVQMGKKKLPPGPKGLPIIRNLHMVGKNLHQDLHKIAKKYDPIMSMRFGLFPVIVASSPYAAEQFLKNHDLVFASRPYGEVSQYIFYDQRNLVSSKYGPYWRNMRKLCTLQLLSNIKIHSFQPIRKQELGVLVNFLKKVASSANGNVVVDLSDKIGSLSANMACLMVFGKKYINDDERERFQCIGSRDNVLMAMEDLHIDEGSSSEIEDSSVPLAAGDMPLPPIACVRFYCS